MKYPTRSYTSSGGRLRFARVAATAFVHVAFLLISPLHFAEQCSIHCYRHRAEQHQLPQILPAPPPPSLARLLSRAAVHSPQWRLCATMKSSIPYVEPIPDAHCSQKCYYYYHVYTWLPAASVTVCTHTTSQASVSLRPLLQQCARKVHTPYRLLLLSFTRAVLCGSHTTKPPTTPQY